MRVCSVIGVVGLSLAASGASGSMLVTNGSFEDVQLAGPTRVAISNLEDWTASGGFMLLEQGVNGTSNTAAHSGTQFVSMGHNAATGDTLSQVLATTPGVEYDVSFFTISIQGVAAQEIEASVFDASPARGPGGPLASATADVDVTNNVWAETSFRFTAVSELSELRFVHTVGGSGPNMAIDTVSVSVVPAPGLLTCMGVAGLLGTRRRR
ncbi:MAG: DUF642 domain-containing protein [Planctomycetota bacterium]